MANVRDWCRKVLSDDPDIQAAVAGRIYPIRLPQRTDPRAPFPTAITVKRLSIEHVEDMAGRTGLAKAVVEVRAWSAAIDELDALAELIVAALENHRDDEADSESGPGEAPETITVLRSHVLGEFDDERNPYTGDDTPIYGAGCQVAVNYREAEI